MELLIFIVVIGLISWGIRSTKARVWPENQLTPKRERIAWQINEERLSPVHAVERLRWHMARKEISRDEMKEVMWMLFPEWMEVQRQKYQERRR